MDSNIRIGANIDIIMQRGRYAHDVEVLLSDLLVVSEEVAANWLV